MVSALKERYINFFTDFGFKRLFGSEQSKNILMDFLNELLQEHEGKIRSIKYLKNEQLGRAESDRRAVYDIYCESESGKKFIVEVQKTKQKFFKDRTLYYSTFPIIQQAQKGEWDYKLEPVYIVAILDFVFDDDMKDKDKYRYDVQLTEKETGKVFYDKLTFIYLEMPKFVKKESELSNRFEKWMYVIKNLSRLDKIPSHVREKIFEKFFEIAEIARLDDDEAELYEDSLKVYRDLNNSLNTAIEEGEYKGRTKGRAEGRVEGKLEMVLNMLAANMPVEQISAISKLPHDDIIALKKNLLVKI